MSDFLRLLYRPCNLNESPDQVLSTLSALVEAEIFGLTSFSFQDTALPRHYTFPDPFAGLLAEAFTTQRQNFLAHPVHTIMSKH